MKTLLMTLLTLTLVGCGSGSNSGSVSSNNTGKRGNIEDRPSSVRGTPDYTITIIEFIGDEAYRSHVGAFDGFPMEFFMEAQIGNYSDRFELSSAEGCGGVRRLYAGDDWAWETIKNVPGDCTVTVHYEPVQTGLPYLVQVDTTGYGASIKPANLSVPPGEPAYFFLDVMDGYEINVSGCNGQRLDDRYVIASVGESCKIHASVTAVSGQTVSITTSATMGARIKPAEANVNLGDLVRFDIETGFGFEATVTGCDGTLTDGSYVFNATTSCSVSVEAYPEQDVPIVHIETTRNEEATINIGYLRVKEYDHEDDYAIATTTIPEVALLDSVTQISAKLAHPNRSIITSTHGCNVDRHSSALFAAEVSLYRTQDTGDDNLLFDQALDLIHTDCTLTLTTEPSSYIEFGDAVLVTTMFNNETSRPEGYDIIKLAYTGTATQFNLIDEPGYVFDLLEPTRGCIVERQDDVITLYHGQKHFRESPLPDPGPNLALCSAFLDLAPED